MSKNTNVQAKETILCNVMLSIKDPADQIWWS